MRVFRDNLEFSSLAQNPIFVEGSVAQEFVEKEFQLFVRWPVDEKLVLRYPHFALNVTFQKFDRVIQLIWDLAEINSFHHRSHRDTS